jgi:hypothetical protein
MARQQPTAADWAVIAVSPALVMLMVGALTFFLAEVLYQGNFYDRLLYTLAWFVFATVLVARVSIVEGYARASVLGVMLAFATFVALCAWIGYANTPVSPLAPVINLFLMAVIWWSAHKLTWDCTHVDEDQKASGRGVLAAAGLDGSAAADNPVQRREDEEAATDEKAERKKRRKDAPGVLGWWARYDRYREARRKRPHTPGVWVVYFALAALPLFGLGQAVIPAEDAARRHNTFQYMVVYVGSALGLLVTTSLLGLRKYLRDRGAVAPAKMTVGWLGLGAGLIVLFLIVGAVLPRPHSETPLVRLGGEGEKSDRKASRNAVVRDKSAGQGDGAAGQKTEGAKDAKDAGKSDQKGGKAGEKGDGGGKGDGKGGDAKGGDGGKQQGNDDRQKGDRNEQRKADDRRPQDKNDAKGDQKQGDEQQKGDDRGGDEKGNDAKGESRSGSQSSVQQSIGKAIESVAGVIKWVVWIALAVAVVVAVFLFGLKWLANFTDWAKNLLDWLRGLFAPKRTASAGGGDDEEAAAEAAERPPPFAAFGNPFDDGSAKRMRPAELIAYTFAAFDAWAWDRDLGRRPDETPNEFAGRLGGEFPGLDKPGRTLASLYAWSLYANRELPPNARELVREFWLAIEQPQEAAAAGEL